MLVPLHLSTTPRSTFVWAADDVQEGAVRRELTAGGHLAASTGVMHVLDVEIGPTACEAVETLRDASFAFVWHPAQRPENRTCWATESTGSDEA